MKRQKKVNPKDDSCFLCKKNYTTVKNKIYVCGKSTRNLNISALILRATNEDLSNYVHCKKLTVCRTGCCNRLVRYDKAIKKVEEIRYDIERDFKVLDPIAVKRMAKDSSSAPTAKRTLHSFNALNVDQFYTSYFRDSDSIADHFQYARK